MRPDRQRNEALRQSLVRVVNGLNEVKGSLPDGEREVCADVASTLGRSVVPQLSADCPLLVAVTGGGSTGKSTLFNSLAGEEVSASSPRAGYTRRIVAAINPAVASDRQKMALLFERFRADASPRALSKPDEAQEPGDPVYAECPSVPEHLVLVDTPDFDTGTREGYTNREAAKEILRVADVVLYLATNATYNNKSGTDFVRQILSEIGIRKVALLYRCFPAYDDDMVREHMAVTLSNLYPDERTAKGACIGVWRIDESNDVAAGNCGPEIRPVNGGASLPEVLAGLDPTKTRTDVMRGEIADSLRHAREWIDGSETERLKYAAYRDSLRFLTSRTCRECLTKAPQRDILKLFAEEWEKAQPWMVRNGHWLSRTAQKTVRKVVGAFRRDKAPPVDAGPGFAESFRDEFLRNASELQRQRESPSVSFEFPEEPDLRPLADALGSLAEKFPDDYAVADGDSKRPRAATVRRPDALVCAGATGRPLGESLDDMAGQALAVMGDTESLRPEVRKLVREFRGKMTGWQTAKEWFSASLDTVAVAGSLTYVVATGDAFTGGTLLSMFGLNDLVAIPALSAIIAVSTGIDRETVKRQMSDLFTTWAKSKADCIRKILEDGITGRDMAACDEAAGRLAGAIGGLGAAIDEARRHADAVFGKAAGGE